MSSPPAKQSSVRHVSTRLGILCALGLWLGLTPTPAIASPEGNPGRLDPEIRPEYEARAHFLMLFAKYTRWPEEVLPPGEGPFLVAVIGEDPFGMALKALEGLRVQGRKVVVRRYRSTADYRRCHLLYFPNGEERHFNPLREALTSHSVLTFGESTRFLEAGGAIQLFSEAGRLRFNVNRDTLTRAHLRVETQVLSLAKQVLPAPGTLP